MYKASCAEVGQQTVSVGVGSGCASVDSGDSGDSGDRGGGEASGSGERRLSACLLRNSRNSSFIARTRASTSSREGRARVRSGVEGVGVLVARSHS